MNTSKWVLAVAVAAVFSTADAATSDDVMLSHYEPLQQLTLNTVSSAAANASQKAGGAAPLVMSFDALGRRFDLELEANSRLMPVARQNPLLDGVDIYRGELAGRPGSWARIVVSNGMPSGLFWDGNEMYAIEAPGDSIVQTDVSVIYRLADAQIAPGSMSCGSASMATTGSAAMDGLLGELGAISQGLGAISEIEMGAIGDYEFTNSKGSDAAAATAITTRLNNVDGIFSQQLGVQINVTVIETFSASNDPFTDERDAISLLDELSTYRSATPAQNSNGLTHLYTGRSLNGSTVGIAWGGDSGSAFCSSFFGAGLSEGNSSSTFDSLVAAHEIGHNFGAPHDGESGSSCESETGNFLMAPQLNNSDQFSSCSIAKMAAEVAAEMAGASCISALPAVDMQVALSGSATVLFGASAVISYDVTNNGTLDATNVVADFTLPANLTLDSVSASVGACTSVAGTVNCALGDVPGMSNRTVDITTTPTTLGPGMISATVSTDIDERPGNNQESLQLTVDPAVDLVVNAPTGASIKLNKSTTINATLENRATLDATGVTLTVDLGNALQATAANWSIGSCTVLAQQVTCQAATFTARSNSTINVTATGITAGNPNITVTLSSLEADLVPSNNSGNGRIEVKDPDDSSGGGATGPWFLCLLAGLTGVRRNRRRTV
jgi:uncharacterized repeat protein (TIGR01451 family)